MEKDGALSKALYACRKGKKVSSTVPNTRQGQTDQFFLGGPSARYGGRQGRGFFPYNLLCPLIREGEHSRWKQTQSFQRQNPKPLYYEPRLHHFKARECLRKDLRSSVYMELVSGKGHHHSCRTSAREGEHLGRLKSQHWWTAAIGCCTGKCFSSWERS